MLLGQSRVKTLHDAEITQGILACQILGEYGKGCTQTARTQESWLARTDGLGVRAGRSEGKSARRTGSPRS
jgi:hypothetical protein